MRNVCHRENEGSAVTLAFLVVEGGWGGVGFDQSRPFRSRFRKHLLTVEVRPRHPQQDQNACGVTQPPPRPLKEKELCGK